MTFLEFLNKKDDKKISQFVMPARVSGLQVVKDLSQGLTLPSLKPTTQKIAIEKPPLPTGLMGRRPSDRTIAKKPTDFLARRGSSFRKGF